MISKYSTYPKESQYEQIQKRYNTLINHYKNTIVEGYVERHHIIPKCMEGTDDISNLVALPPRAHFIAHYLLYRAYPDNIKLAQAFGMMLANNPKQNRVCSSRMYEIARTARSSALKDKPRPEWVKEKLRVPKKSNINYKKPKSEKHSLNISQALKGKKKEKISCPHCNSQGQPSNMYRWHFDNCKNIK